MLAGMFGGAGYVAGTASAGAAEGREAALGRMVGTDPAAALWALSGSAAGWRDLAQRRPDLAPADVERLLQCEGGTRKNEWCSVSFLLRR